MEKLSFSKGKKYSTKSLKKFTGYTSRKTPEEGITINSIKGHISASELESIITFKNELAEKSAKKVFIEITLY